MTVTPEAYLLAARYRRRERNAEVMRPCQVCGRAYVPHLGQLACSNTCCERLLKARPAP